MTETGRGDLADERMLALCGERIADDLERWFNDNDYNSQCEEFVRSELMGIRTIFRGIERSLSARRP